MADRMDLVARPEDLRGSNRDLVARKKDMDGKFTPVAVVKWPNFFQSRNIALDKAKQAYGPTEEHNARGDAYRHIVWQALLAKQYGDKTAKGMGDYHEAPIPAWMGGAGMSPDKDETSMDQFNNAIGRQIAAQAKTEADIYRLAKEYVDSGKAKYMPMSDIIRKSRLEEEEQTY
jgi:hypothetical protein